MSVAIRAITRLQDADDINVTLGAGVDEYALSWNNDTAKFVLRAVAGGGVTDHGALTGLTPDDDHTQYALLAGRAGGQTLYGGTAANDDITIHGTSDATRATSYVILQPTAGNVGIGTTTPTMLLEISGALPRQQITATTNGNNAGLRFSAKSSVGIANNAGIYYTSGVTAGITSYLGFYADDVTPQLTMHANGLVGIGTTAPATLLHVTSTTATTNAIRNVLTLSANVTDTGVGAAGLGPAIVFQAESSTTANTTQARIQALWNDATHATRKADLVLTAYDTAEREGLRIRGAGSAPAIGFLGAAPVARQAHVADPAGGATVDAEARSAINSILATLENFGLHATS